MKKRYLLLAFMMIMSIISFSQVSGTYSIPGTPYPTIASAIAAINSSGVGAGGVTFNIAAGFTETFASNTAGYINTNTGSASNPVIFQKSGAGTNPRITAGTGTGTMDAIICFNGVSYVTFDGIDLQENGANTNSTTRMEWGYALLKVSPTQGSQNIVVKNCAISLNIANTSTFAVYSNNHTISSTTQLTVTALPGTNSNNSFSGLMISNCYNGIYLSGFIAATPYTLYDQNNQVGVAAGNSIASWGGGNVAGYGIQAQYQNGLIIANNTFTGISGTGSVTGNLFAVSLGTAVNANLDVYGNTVTVTYNGTGQFTGITSSMGGSGTTNTVSFYNNTVTGCSMPNMANLAFYGIYESGGTNANFYNNSVTNNTIGSASAAATGIIYGLFCGPIQTTKGPVSVHDNTVSGNTRIQSGVSTGLGNWFYIGGNGSILNCYNNTIDNNTAASTTAQYCVYLGGDAATKNFYNNTIANLLNANGTVYGVYQIQGTTINIFNNKIRNLNSVGTASLVYGIDAFNGTTVNLYNNFISELKAPNATDPNAICGVLLPATLSVTYGLYNNTIYLDAASASTTNFGTSAIFTTSGIPTDLRNNIVVNTSAHVGTGLTVALRYTGAITSSNYQATSNNNDFYAGTPGTSNLIFYDGTNSDQAIMAFKTRVYPRDLSSFSELPPFTNVASPPYDLHLQTTLPTQCESGGTAVATPVNISTDIDGNPRFPYPGYPVNAGYQATGPDLGADEFGGLINDILSPVIAFTPLLNTSSLTNRTLTTALTDATGVPASAPGLPVLYWKKFAAGSWNAATGSWVSGNTYTFSFGGGTLLNDSIYYYIVAQDSWGTPNVGSIPISGSGFSVNPPACATPPPNASLFSYKIIGSVCGTFYIGAGQTTPNYTTITAALADINSKEVTCPVTLLLADAAYPSETYPLSFGNPPGLSSVNTITLKPNAGVTPVISGTLTATNTSIFKFVQSKYITIDGSNSGGTDRSLTIKNAGTTLTTAAVWIGSSGAGKGSSSITIRNCNISNGYSASGAHGIFIGSATSIASSGDNNDNVTIQNNAVSQAYYGIRTVASATGAISNLVISGNVFGSSTPAGYLQGYGIYIQGASAPQVTGNEVFNIISTAVANHLYGIEINSLVTDAVLQGNRVHDLQNNNTTGYGAFGINVGTGGSVVNAVIKNNLVYNITTTNFSATELSKNPFGIRMVNASGTKIYHNTVSLAGTQFNSGTAGTLSSALLIFSATNVTGTDLRGNIFANSLSGSAGSTSYCIYAPTGTTFSTINGNDYWPSGTYGILGFLGSAKTTLPAWQAATGQDAVSISANPSFVSPSDYHPTAVDVQKTAAFIPAVPIDFNGISRTNPTDMGCYQVSGNTFTVVSDAATGVTQFTATLNGAVTANGNTVAAGFDFGPTAAYGTSVSAIPATVTGNIATAVNYTLAGLIPNTIYHYRTNGVSGAVTTLGADMTFTTLPCPVPVITVDGPPSVCINSQGNVYTTEENQVNYQWAIDGGLITAGSGSHSVTVTWNSSGARNISVNYSNFCGTSAPAPKVYDVTVNPLPEASIIADGPTTFCLGGSVLLTARGGTGYLWSTGATTDAIMVTAGDTYSVTVTNEFSCTATASQVVTVISLPVAAISPGGPTLFCEGGSVVLTASGGTGYVWSTGATVDSITVSTGGTYTVTVTNVNSCTAATSQVVTVNPFPAAAGTISGPSLVVSGQAGVVFSVAAIGNATGYNWSLPAGATITDGVNTGSITVSFSNETVSGIITVAGTNGCGNGTASPDFNLTVIPSNSNVTGTISAQECYNAANTITLAGGETTFTVTPAGDVTIIAGNNILFEPGTKVELNGHLQGFIFSGTWCGTKAATIITVPGGEVLANPVTETSYFTLYPNPTGGNFTLELKGSRSFENLKIEVYSMNGQRVLTGNMIGDKRQEFGFSGMPKGLYFVKVAASDYVETIKLVKL